MPETLSKMFKEIKPLKKNGISFIDLVEIMSIQDGASDTEKDLEKIFKMYDKTKVALSVRLQSLLNKTAFLHTTC